jgi:hypothetical protein
MDPGEDLRRRLQARPATLKKQAQDLLSTSLGRPRRQQRPHEGPESILPQQGAPGHDGLFAEGTLGPLPTWASGRGVLRALRLLRFGLLACVFQGQQGARPLLQAVPMALGRGLGHLVLLGLEGLSLLVHPLGGGLQRLIEGHVLALRMPVGTENLLTTIVDIECPMVHHVREAVLLSLVSLTVDPWPCFRLQGVLPLRSAPIPQGLAGSGLDDHNGPGILFAGLLPWPALAPGAIL